MQFYMPRQKHDFWCWAAVTVSIDYWLSQDSAWNQCEVARFVHGQDCCANRATATCCMDPEPPPCNRAASLSDALHSVGRSHVRIPAPLSFDEIVTQIDAGHPIGVRIGWYGGSGHFVVIRGYHPSPSGAHKVDVADPYYRSGRWYYEDFRDAYQASVVSGGGHWTHSYLMTD
ncbi:MAG: hypothetical protein JNN08_30940 [Bryobacterales bacterium]|nr:hypothetical protein [Bryobacterales bacterium]